MIALNQSSNLTDVVAEGWVVGSMLTDPGRIPSVLEIVQPAQFADHDYRVVFDIIAKKHRQGEPIDAALVLAELRKCDGLSQRPEELLFDIGAENVSTSAHAVYYAKIVQDNARRRQALDALDDARTKLLGDSSVQEVVTDVHAFAEDALREADTLGDPNRPALVCMADVEPRQVEWLWPGRIARGRLTLAVGVPGAGKSYLTCDMAARVSTGTPWPDGSECQRGSVVLITAEDDPHDTIRPRLDAHQADVSRIHLLSGVLKTQKGKIKDLAFTLSDVDTLRQALEAVVDCKLVIIDPIGSFLGGRCDAHRDNEVRAVLAPIAKLAEQYGAAVLIIAHRRKGSGGSADDTALGSRAFTGIARAVWHLSRDPGDSSRRLLLPGKSNLAAEQTGYAFAITGEPASLRWERDPVAMTADEALARENGDTGERSAVEEATDWLRAALDGGPQPSGDLKEMAKRDGIAWRTVERAKRESRELGVTSGPNGFGGPWVWSMPGAACSDNLRQDSAVSAKDEALADSGETVTDTIQDSHGGCGEAKGH